MAYKIFIHSKAQKELDKITGNNFQHIVAELEFLEKNPRPIGCIKLTDKEGYRIRVGKYRILYTINDKTKNIEVYRICHRKDVYR